ncbi:MAG TPA: hypothetical protein VK590_02030 [Saprospiraceae bacterium]|nr:hypothetical protein [Saprospiraceae bacterium]
MPVLTFKSKDKFQPIAIITSGKFKGKIIYLDPNHDDDINSRIIDLSEKLEDSGVERKKRNSILGKVSRKLKKENGSYISGDLIGGKFDPLPNFQNLSMERPYVFAPAGAGKTVYICKQIEYIKSIFPKKKVYLFSKLEDDESIDEIEPSRILLNEDFLDTELESSMFRDSICVFDDIDTIKNEDIRKKIIKLRDDLLECGRHDDITIMCTSHIAANNKKTRELLNECSSYTMFPKSGQTHPITYICKEYLGMNREQIQKILDSKSRWVTIHKSYPLYVISEDECYLL